MRKFLRTLKLTLVFVLGLVGIFRAQTVIINPATDGGFELGATFADNGWTAVNAATNTWQLGTTPSWFTGDRGAFVSSDAGTSWAYNTSTVQTSHFYKDVTFPAGETAINLSFDFRANGNDGNWDNLLVYVTDVAVSPTTGGPINTATTITNWAGYTNGTTGYYLLQRNGTTTPTTTTNVSYNFTAAQGTYCAGSTRRIIFTWKNDGGGGSQPPASLDNISLVSSCTGATTLAASSISATSATLNANTFTDATGYNFRYRATGSTTWILASGNPYTTPNAPLTGLTPQTGYEFQVAAVGPVCTAWSSTATFTTFCNPFTIPYFEGFESGYTHNTAVGGCISQASVTGTAAWNANTSFTTNNRTPRTGSWNAFIPWSNEDWLFIPVTLTGGVSYTASIYARQDGATATNANFLISYGTTNSAVGMTNSIVAATGLVNGDYQLIEGAFTPATTGIYFVGFKGFINVTPNAIAIDDIVIKQTPTCVVPTAITNTVTSNTTATHSWSLPASGTPIGYEWLVSTSMTPPASGTATTNLTETSSGLTPNTTYYLHLRADCGSGDISAWTTTSFFTGHCLPSSGSQASWVSAFETTGGNTNFSYTAASGTAGGYNDQVANFSVSNYIGGTTNLSMTAGGPTCGFAVWVDWNNNFLFETTERIFNTTGYVTTATGSFTVPLGTANGSYRMRVVTDYNSSSPTNPCSALSRGEYVDFTFNVVSAPTCFAPTALTNTQLSLTSATHSWTAPSTGTPIGYEWIVTTSATPPASGAATTNLTETSTGLLSDVTYYLHVRTDCGAGDFSAWATSSFVLGYCIPTTSSGCTDGDVIARVTLNTLDNNSGTGCPSGTLGYSNYTTDPTLTTSLLPSTTYGCTVYAGQYGEGYAAWIDYNDDGVFDNVTERIGFSNGQVAGSGQVGVLGSSATFPITLACTPPAGVHRLRVRAMYFTNGSDVTPCTNNSYGETEDYLITIVAPPTCPSPGAPVAGTATSFTLSFDFPLNCATATNYDIEYGPAGFTPGTGTIAANQVAVINGTTGTVTLSGLTPLTVYDAYIRANCGAGGVSTWTLVATGSTLQPPCSGTPNTPVVGFVGNATICDGSNTIVSASGMTDNVLQISNQWQVSTNNVDWNPIAGEVLPTYQSGALTAGTYYYRYTSTCLASTQTSTSNVVTLLVNAPPVVTITAPNNGTFCGTQTLTAAGAVSYVWSPSTLLNTATGASVVYTGTTSGTLTATGTDANGCSASSAPFVVTYTTPDPINWVAATPSFCGTGGTTSVSVSSLTNYTYSLVNNSTAVISGFTPTSFNTTVTETSAFLVTGTDPVSGCIAQTPVQINVFPLPTANVTSDVNGVCPGTAANINTGLSAGNFTSTSIPHAPLTAPVNAVTLATGGAELVPTDLGFGLDDGGWSGIPVGFNFNFFGTPYNTISIGTNGTVFFGATPNVADFAFTTLPSTTEPFNMVAVLAMDNDLGDVTGGTIKYWTEGTAPNRKFIVSYENVQEYFATETSTAQAIFYETVGEIDVHVTSSTNIDQNKLVGVNNGDGTVGVLAFASGTVASPTNPITNPFAYRFAPPANYTTVWTSTNTQGTTTIASGTNIFTQAVIPTETTVYSISYTNQTTGCTNAPGSADVTITILGNVAPVGVNALSSVTNVCDGDIFQVTTDYTGSFDGLTYQWQFSTDNGASFTDIVGQTSLTLSTSQNDTTIYRLAIFSCGGTPSYSSQLTMNMSAPTDCYCVPTSSCNLGDVIASISLNTLSNVSGTACTTGGYTDYTTNPTLTTTLLPSSSYVCVVGAANYAQSVAVWIDYNDDGLFDNATERIGYTNNPIPVNGTASFNVVLDCNPPVGVHRMRVRSSDDFFVTGIDQTPCTNYSFGETEDYLITIAPAPTCPSPGLLVGGTTTTTSADLSWTLGCSTASAFDFEYGPVGFTQGAGTLVENVTATTSTTLSGLIPNSSYQVYYRANCGNGDVSAWSVPVTVSTQCAPITLVNPGAQVVCNTYALPTLAEVTPSNNSGLVLSYRNQPNGGGTVITGPITTTQTVYIYGVAGACSANQSFLVTVNNGSTSTTNITQCITYTWTNNVTYTASGTHTQTLTNAAGCDSVATLNLTITQPTTSTLNELACQTFTLNNQTYTASGTYVQTLTNAAGCDSTLTLNLTIGQPDVVSVTEVACDSYTWNGTIYTVSGVYNETLTNIFGCDSVVTLDLTINNTSSSSEVVTQCGTYNWNSVDYTSSGTYTFTAQNAAGCDSTATLVLTIGNNSSTTTAATCGSFTWTNGTTYTESGTYTQTLTNVAGCDSLVTLNLTINPTPTATATDNGNGTGTLVASTGASYQWIDCATNTPITGATNATYTAEINGSYAVIVTNSSNCSATSSCVIVDYIGLEENTVSFNVYPNPTTGAINIVIDQTTANYDVTVEDMNGRAIANFGSLINGNGVYSLDLSNVVTGVYFIKLRNELEERTVRIIKQ
jgi:hypothetical protein